DDWRRGLEMARNNLVSIVEADCLVNSGYFSSMVGLFQKNRYYRQLAMMSSAFGTNSWAPKFYGYSKVDKWSEPAKLGENELQTNNKEYVAVEKNVSSEPYQIKMGYVPGAVIRRKALLAVTEDRVLQSGDL